MIDVSWCSQRQQVLFLLFLTKTASLKPVVGTVVQDGVVLTPSKYPEALIAFTRSQSSKSLRDGGVACVQARS